MKLYLHIGTEKTGSSHLQSMCAINRNLLQQNGVCFPLEGKDSKSLIKGEISAGNAQSLTNSINANNFTECESFVAQCINQARVESCHSIFLSNELLLLALSKDNKLQQFISILNKLGVFEVEFLLILRDPIDQALSLYKHRAKSGSVLDIEEWPKKHYLYGKALVSFLEHEQLEKINLTVRKFSMVKGALEIMLFREWLNIKEDLISPPKVVNPSLSLSELILLKKVRKHQPFLVNILYRKLIKVPKKNKYENGSIEQYHKEILSNEMAKYKGTWEICNQYLSTNEKIVIPKEDNKQILTNDKNSSFSDEQMEVIACIISESLTLKVRLSIKKLKFKMLVLNILKALNLK
tara:strand:- start:2656 stop:3708 length:1053 start_codon:yes stop_codon:yes gene_type:complete